MKTIFTKYVQAVAEDAAIELMESAALEGRGGKLNKAFNTLIKSINAQLEILNENGYAIYDTENPEYFISEIVYNQENDQIEFKTESH